MTIVGHSPPLRVRVDWSGVERGGEGKGGDRLWTAKGVSLDRNSDATVLATRLTQLDSGLQWAVELDQGYGDDFSLSRRASQS